MISKRRFLKCLGLAPAVAAAATGVPIDASGRVGRLAGYVDGATPLFTAVPFEYPWPDVPGGEIPKLSIRIRNVNEAAARVAADIELSAKIDLIAANGLTFCDGAGI